LKLDEKQKVEIRKRETKKETKGIAEMRFQHRAKSSGLKDPFGE